MPRVLRRHAVTLLPPLAQYGRKKNFNHIFTSKLSFTPRSKANLILFALNVAVGYYFLSFSWRDQLWTVTVSLSFPQVTYEYAAPAGE